MSGGSTPLPLIKIRHIVSCDKSCVKYFNTNIAIIFKVFFFGNRYTYTYNYKLLNNYFNI